jgi:RNA polymerase sigma-70 factor (ECF subfamily)
MSEADERRSFPQCLSPGVCGGGYYDVSTSSRPLAPHPAAVKKGGPAPHPVHPPRETAVLRIAMQPPGTLPRAPVFHSGNGKASAGFRSAAPSADRPRWWRRLPRLALVALFSVVGTPEGAEPEAVGETAAESLKRRGFADEALPHMEAVFRFSLRLSRGRQDEAEDLTQDTFLQAYRAWDSYTPGTNCRSWLFTICRNRFLRQEERRGRRPEVVESQLDAAADALAAGRYGPVDTADPERGFWESFIDAEVLAALDRIPTAFREVVVLSDVEGLTYPELAQVLALPIGTVKSRLFRGRRLLQEALYDFAVENGYVRREAGR